MSVLVLWFFQGLSKSLFPFNQISILQSKSNYVNSVERVNNRSCGFLEILNITESMTVHMLSYWKENLKLPRHHITCSIKKTTPPFNFGGNNLFPTMSNNEGVRRWSLLLLSTKPKGMRGVQSAIKSTQSSGKLLSFK